MYQIESIGGLKIQHQVDGGKEVVFRFHGKSKLQGGAAVAVSLPVCVQCTCLSTVVVLICGHVVVVR